MTQRETVLVILCLVPSTALMLAFWIAIRLGHRVEREIDENDNKHA